MLGRLFGKGRASARGAPELLAEAFAHHQAGRYDEAQAGYRAVLAMDAGNFDAEHLLGVLALQRTDAQGALQHFLRACELAPASVYVSAQYASDMKSAAPWRKLSRAAPGLRKL